MTTIDMAETISTSLPVFNDVRAWYGPALAQNRLDLTAGCRRHR